MWVNKTMMDVESNMKKKAYSYSYDVRKVIKSGMMKDVFLQVIPVT